MSKSKLRAWIDSTYASISPKLFTHWSEYLKKDLADCNSVLDLGCGVNSMIQYCNVPYSMGVDLYEPYLEESRKKGFHNQYIKADIRKLELEPKSFDAVILLAVLEHLTKEEGYAVIQKIEGWARKKVILTTTNGYLFQDDYDGNPLQEHKSGWDVKDLKDSGYKVRGIFGWKPLRGYLGHPKYKPAFMWGIISGITQYLTYYCPRLAFIFYARKDLWNQK